MPLMATDAIVLHVFDYSETSRILRLATRELGVQSVLARGAWRSRTRFGTALDIFAGGVAQLYLKEGRDLQTLSAFDITSSRDALGADLVCFTSSSALAELVLRFATDDTHPALFETFAAALDTVTAAEPARAREAGLAGAWRLVAELGFAPALSACSTCHAPVDPVDELRFNHEAGGILCRACARLYPAGRTLPSSARACVSAWMSADRVAPLDDREMRAHQRLLREFLQHHLADGRTLRAFDAWERGGWSAS